MPDISSWKIIGLCIVGCLIIIISVAIQMTRKIKQSKVVLINVSSDEFLLGSVLSRRFNGRRRLARWSRKPNGNHRAQIG